MAGKSQNVIRIAKGGDRASADVARPLRDGPVAIGPRAKEARRAAILARRERLATVVADPRPPASDIDGPANAPVRQAAAVPAVPAPAPRAGRSPWQGVLAFAALVLLPICVAAWYLWAVAVDQYASRLAFTIRHDGAAPAAGLMGGIPALAALSGSGRQEADVVAAFVTSPDLVARLDQTLDLRAAFSAAHARDPIFALAPGAAIEDLTRHWARQVSLAYDPASGLIDLTVRAFDPVTARAVARAVLAESTSLVDRLSRAARDEAMVHADADLARAEDRLSDARMAMARFRAENRLVDPAGEAAGQSGLVATLEAQLADALIAQDMLAGTTRPDDPRVTQAARRIAVIQARIGAERDRFAPEADMSGPSAASVAATRDYAGVMAEYERLAVDQRFAEAAYVAALSAVEAARADAARRALYLAPHVEPTLAERAEYPRRWMILGLVAGGAALLWSVLALTAAALRDRS